MVKMSNQVPRVEYPAVCTVEMMNRFSARALVLPDYALIVGRHGTGRNRYEYFMITKATKGTKQEELTLDGRVI